MRAAVVALATALGTMGTAAAGERRSAIYLGGSIGARFLSVTTSAYSTALQGYYGTKDEGAALDLRLAASYALRRWIELGVSVDYLYKKVDISPEPGTGLADGVYHHGLELGPFGRLIARGRSLYAAVEVTMGAQTLFSVLRGVSDTHALFFVRPTLSAGVCVERGLICFDVSGGYSAAFPKRDSVPPMDGAILLFGLNVPIRR